MFDSPTYSGRPHPLSRVLVPEALVAAWTAVRALARPAAARRAPLRLRDHHLAAGVGARGRARAAAARACPGSPTCATRGPSSRCAPSSRPRPSGGSTSGSSAAGSGAADAVVCVSEPAADGPAPARDRDPAAGPERLGPGVGAGRRRRPPACSTPTGARSSTRAASAATGATRGRWSSALAELARSDRGAAAKLELVIAGPLTDERGGAVRHRRLAGADRRSPAASSASGRSPCSARPTRCCCSPSRPARSCSTSSCSSTWRAARRSSRSPPGPRRAGSRASSAPRWSPPTTRRRSPRRWPGSRRASSPRPAPDAVAPYTYPAPAEGMAAAVEAAISRAIAASASMTPREVVESFWEAMRANDWDAPRRALRRRRRDRVAVHAASGSAARPPGPRSRRATRPAGRWTFDLHRLVGDERTAVSECTVTDGEQAARVVAISEVEGDAIVRQIEYWTIAYEPADWRADLVERIEPGALSQRPTRSQPRSRSSRSASARSRAGPQSTRSAKPSRPTSPTSASPRAARRACRRRRRPRAGRRRGGRSRDRPRRRRRAGRRRSRR